jgi:hypothetical protein
MWYLKGAKLTNRQHDGYDGLDMIAYADSDFANDKVYVWLFCLCWWKYSDLEEQEGADHCRMVDTQNPISYIFNVNDIPEDKHICKAARNSEYPTLMEYNTWDLVPALPNHKIVSQHCKFIFGKGHQDSQYD